MYKELFIVDYIGNSNKNNQPIGHPVKVINDFFELLYNDVNIKIAIPITYKNKINYINKAKEIIWFDRVTQVLTINSLPRIILTINKIRNIKQVIRNCQCENIWFINVDFSLGIALMLYKRNFKNKNIFVTLYMKNYDNIGVGVKIKNYFYQKIIKNKSSIIVSNSNLSFDSEKTLNIPDYFYSDRLYSKYKNIKKENKVVCVGTMNETKDLETLISVFNKIEIELYIIGSFSDKLQLDRCNLIKGDNIFIEDRILQKEEYYNLIASSKYIIIPYKEDAYTNRTSGVLLEAIFLKSIPIAPKFLLNFNNINGVKYDNIDELIDFFTSTRKDSIFKNEEIEEFYREENVREKIINMII